MNEDERKKFVLKEIEAIYEEFDNSVNQLVLLKYFFRDLIAVAKGSEPNHQLSKIINKDK